MSMPNLSHLQFAMLDVMGPREISGRDLRSALKSEKGVSKSGPAFYQLMARLEDANFVNGRYEEKVVEGQRIKERRYLLTADGESARRQAILFYTSNLTPDLRPSDA